MLELPTFQERYEYLKLDGCVGRETFGSMRYLNQRFYSSQEWKRFRRQMLIRDNGCDLGIPGREIRGRIILHHIDPIDEDAIVHDARLLMDPNNVICVSAITHQAIHYGDSGLLFPDPVERRPNDTCPWKEAR